MFPLGSVELGDKGVVARLDKSYWLRGAWVDWVNPLPGLHPGTLTSLLIYLPVWHFLLLRAGVEDDGCQSRSKGKYVVILKVVLVVLICYSVPNFLNFLQCFKLRYFSSCSFDAGRF